MIAVRTAGVAAAALTTAFAFSLSAAVADEAPTEDTPTTGSPLQGASVEVVTVNGSGCPEGSVDVGRARDGSISLRYEEFLARTGEGASVLDFRKNCALSLQVDGPDGYSFAVRGVDHQGVAYLQDGVTGLLRTNYYIQGSTEDSTQEETFEGPYASLVSATENLSTDELVWTPCGEERNININIELRVSAVGSDDLNLVALQSSTAPGSAMQLAWRRC